VPEGAVHNEGAVAALLDNTAAQIFWCDDAVLLAPRLGTRPARCGRVDDPHVHGRVARGDDDADLGAVGAKGDVEAQLDVKRVGIGGEAHLNATGKNTHDLVRAAIFVSWQQLFTRTQRQLAPFASGVNGREASHVPPPAAHRSRRRRLFQIRIHVLVLFSLGDGQERVTALRPLHLACDAAKKSAPAPRAHAMRLRFDTRWWSVLDIKGTGSLGAYRSRNSSSWPSTNISKARTTGLMPSTLSRFSS